MGYDPDEWSALPWHWQRVYLDGILEQFAEEGEADAPAPADPTATIDLASAGVDPGRLGFG